MCSTAWLSLVLITNSHSQTYFAAGAIAVQAPWFLVALPNGRGRGRKKKGTHENWYLLRICLWLYFWVSSSSSECFPFSLPEVLVPWYQKWQESSVLVKPTIPQTQFFSSDTLQCAEYMRWPWPSQELFFSWLSLANRCTKHNVWKTS